MLRCRHWAIAATVNHWKMFLNVEHKEIRLSCFVSDCFYPFPFNQDSPQPKITQHKSQFLALHADNQQRLKCW